MNERQPEKGSKQFVGLWTLDTPVEEIVAAIKAAARARPAERRRSSATDQRKKRRVDSDDG